MKAWIGIDVSKLTLDVCWYVQGEPTFLRLPNRLEGFKALFSQLPPFSHVVLEATGAYYLRLAHFLMEKGIPLSVINPLSIKRYAQMKLARVKTDKYDAALIAQFGASQEPAVWTLPDAHLLDLQQLITLEDELIVQKGMLQNQKEAFSQSPFASKMALKSIDGIVRRLEKEIGHLQSQVKALMKAHYPRETEILRSIPGLGPKTARRQLNNGRPGSACLKTGPLHNPPKEACRVLDFKRARRHQEYFSQEEPVRAPHQKRNMRAEPK